MKRFFLQIFLILISVAFSQEKIIQAKFIENSLSIDGKLDEMEWSQAEEGIDFIEYFPTDSIIAKYQTKFKVLYTKDHLYFGFIAYSENNDFVVSSLKRDFSGVANDNISLLFDTFNDETNAYFFGVTPFGVRREGLISEGGQVRNGFNINWDTKWKADAQRYDNYYTVEIEIPFNSLKFIEGQTSWRFRSYRWDLQTNVQSTWVKVPQNLLLSNLAYMGTLEFEKPLGKSTKATSIIPFVNALSDKDHVLNNSNSFIKTGADAKIAIGDGLNLDLTINPDFSNTEVDDIFTNLTRFELRLPEKRQFFIDNNDLFANFGNSFSEAKPFFSRRIGLAKDKDGHLIQNDINVGLRLSGKIDENWRIGLFSIQTSSDESNEIASNNNSMLALQRKVGSRSNIGAFIVNRQTIGEYDYLDSTDRFNRVVGIDYNLASSSDLLRGRFYIHKSYEPFDSKGNYSLQGTMTYQPKGWTIIQDFVFVDTDFRADLGFVPRKDFLKHGNGIIKFLYPETGSFNSHEIRLLTIHYWQASDNKKKTDYSNSLRWEGIFNNNARVDLSLNKNYIFLNYPFDPTRKEGSIPLPENTAYKFDQISAGFRTSNTNIFTYSLELTSGEFFNGNITSLEAQVNYRFQPWANLSLVNNYDKIELPDPYSSTNIFLTSARAEITFNKSLFWNTLIQFSNQSENLGINSRLQWRFSPLSDIYLVYNDNYITKDEFSPRYRSINLKLTYWLDI